MACALYAGEVLPLGKAAALANMGKFQFAVELGRRKIGRHSISDRLEAAWLKEAGE